MAHFNWLLLIPGVNHHNVHVFTFVLASVLLIVVGLLARMSLKKVSAESGPAGYLGLRGLFESIIEFIVSLVDMVIGEHGRKYVPMFATIFFFILANNLLGLVPGMTPATENINTTVALGLFSFLVFNFFGLKENGFSYIKHFFGPVWWLAWLIGPIEILSMLVRPMALGLRMSGNMTGDHAVLSIFLGLVPVGIPAVFYMIGVFVCFLQAFIFTLLSMVYVSMATAHEEH